MYSEKQMDMEQKIEKLEKSNKVLTHHNETLRETVDYLMEEQHKREDMKKYQSLKKRQEELMNELREIENDMKFYEKDN